MPKHTITFSIVDDDTELREKIAVFVGTTPGYRCVSQYESAEDALEHLPQDRPEVVLMDINIDGMSGIDCVRKLKPLLPESQFIMLTVFEDTKNYWKRSVRCMKAVRPCLLPLPGVWSRCCAPYLSPASPKT
jgi:DNA-binding NarL/FixJ family response regulator